jgi:hypothetical protein
MKHTDNTGLATLGEEAAALPTIPQFTPAIVVAQTRSYLERADRVFASAERAVIDNPGSAEKATDFLKAIQAEITQVDDARKRQVDPYNTLVTVVNSMYKPASNILARAKESLRAKLLVFQQAERAKADALLQAERARIAAEAAAHAEQAIEEGDGAGAREILTAAANVKLTAATVTTQGRTASAGTSKRKVGKIMDLRKFLAWVAADKTATGMATIAGVEVAQATLNQLARMVLATQKEDPTFTIPGFLAEEQESLNVR